MNILITTVTAAFITYTVKMINTLMWRLSCLHSDDIRSFPWQKHENKPQGLGRSGRT